MSAAASLLNFPFWQGPGLCVHDYLHSLDLIYWFGGPWATRTKGRQLPEQQLTAPSAGVPEVAVGHLLSFCLPPSVLLACFLL